MSKLLAMMMGSSGGGETKTLNLESVGGASYNKNYIYNGSSNTSKYFQTKENVVFAETDTVEFKIKFRVGAGSSPGTGIFCNGNVLTDHLFSFNQRSQASYYLTTTLNGVMNNMFSWRSYVGQWVIVSLLKSSSNIVATLSVNGSVVSSYTISNNFSMNDKVFFGIGCLEQNIDYTSMQSDVAIDFRGTDILINGESVLWVEESDVEFKTYCYAQNNGCCLLDIGENKVAGIYVKGVLTTNYPSTTGWKVICGGASDNTQYIDSFLSFNNISTKYTEIKTGYAGGFSSETLIDSSGNIIKTNFENSKIQILGTNTGAKIGVFAQYSNDENIFKYHLNDFAKIENIILYDRNDVELANLVPAIVEGESGMYDTINEQFYGNANSVGSLVCE